MPRGRRSSPPEDPRDLIVNQPVADQPLAGMETGDDTPHRVHHPAVMTEVASATDALRLAELPFSTTPLGLVVHGNPTYEEYEQYTYGLFAMANACMWAVGDLILYGESRQDWGERYAQAAEETQRSVDSIQSSVNLARKFPRERRRPVLSFSHHREVAAFNDELQDIWLTRAEDGSWSAKRLRHEIRSARAEEEDAQPPLPDVGTATPNRHDYVVTCGPGVEVWETEAQAQSRVDALASAGLYAEWVRVAVNVQLIAVADVAVDPAFDPAAESIPVGER